MTEPDQAETTSDASQQYVLDTTVHQPDYVDTLFNNIDWDARKKKPMSEKRWLEPGTWETHSYTMKYLSYKIEEGQVDITNPFHIEEGNMIRSRLMKKREKKVLLQSDVHCRSVQLIHNFFAEGSDGAQHGH